MNLCYNNKYLKAYVCQTMRIMFTCKIYWIMYLKIILWYVTYILLINYRVQISIYKNTDKQCLSKYLNSPLSDISY